MSDNHVDVLIVGAGISGVGAACHLSRDLPGRSYRILERRQAIGGTWDLFRYPGVRSDSDMYTFGFNFRPWHDTTVLADGTSIRNYIVDTAREFGVTDHITFGTRVIRVSWTSEDALWRVESADESDGTVTTWTCHFLMMCTGYYDYDNGYRPDFAGESEFTGTLVHPQHWPADLDYRGKRVVVIGSGATAITLVPAMAETAGHVTMLQRSPSYVVSVPAVDTVSEKLRRVLPASVVYRLARTRNIGIQRGMFELARRRPAFMRKLVLAGARKGLGDDADLVHFNPRYEPWDQRLCVVPDGDLFRAVRAGKADVMTDTIDAFTPEGIRLTSGAVLNADVIVTATGLQVQLLGNAEIVVDGQPINPRNLLTYKSVLVENIPNAAIIFGYTNASWTLKVDIACAYVVRLLRYLQTHGYASVVARAPAEARTDGSAFGSLKSGYIERGNDLLPREGKHAPWIVLNNYIRDAVALRFSKLNDGHLVFKRAG